jgi:hypothetical protein
MKIKDWPRVRWLEIGLVLAFVLAGLAIAFSNEYAVMNWFLTDDAFYYFKVAQNIAEGYGSTFDGINLTNGYHPLWMLICIPIFALARLDLVLPLRIVILVTVGLGAGSAVFLFRLLRRVTEEQIAFLTTVLWAFTWSFFRVTTMGGMESILSAFFILLLWTQVAKLNQQKEVTLKQVWKVGLIAIFTFLSRLDNIFLVFFAGLWIWLRWWQPMDSQNTDLQQRWWWRIQTGVAYYLPVSLTLLTYLGINQMIFGIYMPISSQVKEWWGTLGLTIYGGPLYIYPEYIFEYLLPARRGVGPWALVTAPIHHAAEDFWAGLGRMFTLEPLAITYLVLGLILAIILFPGRKTFFKAVRRLGLGALLLACLAQSIYYFWRDAYNLRVWYWISQNLFLLILLGVLATVLFGYVHKLRYSKAVLTGLVVIVTTLTFINFGRLVAKNMYPGLAGTPHYYQQVANEIREHTTPDDVIATIGSGTIGYFLVEYRIINMDGLINSADYFEHLKSGTVSQFLDEMGVDYVYGNDYLVTQARPYGENLADHLTPFTGLNLNNKDLKLWHFSQKEQ